MNTKREELAWAAGFFDGEGTTYSTGPALQLSVGQVNVGNLRRFMSAIGVTEGLGRPKKIPNRKPFSQFRVYGPKAISAIRLLWPWLGEEKREQALLALLRYSHRSVAPWRSGLHCARGHLFSESGKTSKGQCCVCREAQRHGPLAPIVKRTAMELRIGVLEYVPAPLYSRASA